MALISYRNLTVSFGGPLLLDDAGITIDKKERICLLGRNGEGKSTLLRILAGQVEPDKGESERLPDFRVAKLDQETGDCGGLDVSNAEKLPSRASRAKLGSRP